MDDLNFDDSVAEALEAVEAREEAPEKTTPEAQEASEPEQVEEEQPDTEETDQGESEEAKPAEEEQPLEPHSRWSAEDKERFATLPREAQDFVLKRESEVNALLTQKTQELAEKSRDIDPVLQIFEDRRHIAAQYGMTPVQEFDRLYQIANYAEKDPAGYIKWFAEQRGINLQGESSGDDEYVDPDVAALKTEITQLKQLVTTQQQQSQQAEMSKTQSLVDSFIANEQDYPHFKELGNSITAIIPAIRQANPGYSPETVLKEAYEQAKWADPGVREKLLAEQKKAEESKRIEEQKAAAAKASKAKQINVRTSATDFNGEAPKKYDSLDAAFDATAQEVVERLGAA